MSHPDKWPENITNHPCSGKCSRFDGEQCNTCLVSDDVCDFAVGDLVVPKSNTVNSVPAVREVIELDGDDKFLITIGGNHRQSWRFIDGWRTATLAEIAAGYRIDAPTVCVEQETLELFNSKHCSPRNYIKQYYSNVTDAQRLKDLDASVDHAKAALATFNYKPIPTDRELQQAEQIRILRTDRNVWCAMFFIAVVGYGVARWML